MDVRRWAVLMVGVLGSPLLLTACGGGDSGSKPLPPLPSLSTHGSPSSSPTSASTHPSAAVSPFPATSQGARDFTRYLYAEINRAYAAKDPEIVRPLFAPGCETCDRYTHTLEGLRSGNVTASTSDQVVISAETPGAGVGPQVHVMVTVRSPGAVFTDRDGTQTKEDPSVDNIDVTLQTTTTSYLLLEMRHISKES